MSKLQLTLRTSVRMSTILITLLTASIANAQVQSTTKDTIGPAKGNLLIIGGGSLGKHDELWSKFIELAGGPNASIVYIPTANGRSSQTEGNTTGQAGSNHANNYQRVVDKLKRLGAKQVTVLDTADPKIADTEAFAKPLETATGVYFEGGRQWHLADSYLGTRTLKEIWGVLDRGGVVAGSSAGATIIGSYLVRGDTKGNLLVQGDHQVGFGFLKNSAIDQHILLRNREFDLIPVIEKHPELLGIGINQGTAILVHANQFEVIYGTYVAITDGQHWKKSNSVSGNDINEWSDASNKGKFYFLGVGDKFDLATRTPLLSDHEVEPLATAAPDQFASIPQAETTVAAQTPQN